MQHLWPLVSPPLPQQDQGPRRPFFPAFQSQNLSSSRKPKKNSRNKTCNTQSTHAKDVFFEHLCSSTCSCLTNLPFTTYQLPRTNPEETRYSNLQKRYPSWTETGGVEPPGSLWTFDTGKSILFFFYLHSQAATRTNPGKPALAGSTSHKAAVWTGISPEVSLSPPVYYNWYGTVRVPTVRAYTGKMVGRWPI